MLPFRGAMEITATPPPGVAVHSTAARPGALGLLREAFAEILSRQRLIRYLVRADLKKKGADTLLGNIWWVVDPLLQMVVYVILVTVITQRALNDYPLFVFCAILPWKWFTTSINDAIGSVVGQERLIKQLQFPKVILPTATTAAAILNFAFGFIPLMALIVVFYMDRLSWHIVLVPLVAVVQFTFTLALAYLVSSINVFYRDIANISRHALRLWFYLSPGLYSTAQLQTLSAKNPIVGQLMQLNPFYTFFESYRNVIYGTVDGRASWPLWEHLLVWFGVSLVLLALTTLVFKRLEPAFAKVL